MQPKGHDLEVLNLDSFGQNRDYLWGKGFCGLGTDAHALQGSLWHAAGAVVIGICLANTPASARSVDEYNQAVGQVAAAMDIYGQCKGVGPNGPRDNHGFIFAATDILAKEGFRRHKLRALLLYGKTSWISQMSAAALAERGIKATNKNAICMFGRAVAGSKDTIGRFLVKE